MRRFVALPVPPAVRQALLDAVAPARERLSEDLRWTRPEGWHVTLAFLGEVADADVDRVVEVIRACPQRPPSTLRLTTPGRFGSNVLWVGVGGEPEGSVAALGDEIQRALARADLPVQRQMVRPHVTLARSRRGGVDDRVVGALDVPALTWPVTGVELWRSILGDGPARYETDASVAAG